MKKSIYMLTAGVLATALTYAQETADEKKDDGKFSVSGYIDSYYLTALNRPASGTLMGASAGRAFDRLTNQFALGLAQTRFSYTQGKSEMVIDLTFGPNAELGNFGNTRDEAAGYVPSIPAKAALYGTSAAIKQAYFTYNITEKLSFTVGQFGTHIGYEVIDAPVNFHYSLSNLFNNGPFYHVGGKLNYAISETMGVMVGVVNNWDALTDWKTQKSLVGQFYVAPIEGWNVYLNGIGGAFDDGYAVPASNIEPAGGATVGYTRMLFDLTTGYQISDNFYFGLNAAYGMYNLSEETTFADGETGKTAPWFGIAVYPNYKINDMISIGARFEHFNDKKGVRYFGAGYSAVNNSFTLTAPITLADGHVILKPEIRFDAATAKEGDYSFNYYENKDGGAAFDPVDNKYTGGSATQTTFGVAFIYKY